MNGNHWNLGLKNGLMIILDPYHIKMLLVVTWSLTDKLMFIEGDSGEIPNTKRNLKFWG